MFSLLRKYQDETWTVFSEQLNNKLPQPQASCGWLYESSLSVSLHLHVFLFNIQ